MARPISFLAAIGLALILVGCGRQDAPEKQPQGPQATGVTAVRAESRAVETTVTALGQVDSKSFPEVAAEVAGRVIRLAAEEGDSVRQGQLLAVLDAQEQQIALRAARADVNRLQALIANQQRTVKRYRDLLAGQYVARNTFEEAETQLQTLREQLAGARAQVAQLERDLRLARVLSPMAGQVQERLVSVGDYVTVGKPLFRLVGAQKLQVHLPLPESYGAQLRPGLPVRLSTPADPDKPIEGQISEIRPMIGASNRALDVLVEVDNPGTWRPGASVTGEVVLATRENAVMLPEQSVVQRPAGEVVYVAGNGKAGQRLVKTGVRRDGLVEILSGVAPGELVVVEGAGFLTQGAPIRVREARS
ncbi:efflux RND transporter periplasmic adaptor subunit [Thermithiobacillus plumbiphilus]|uniref:Efflux RND transporter periplasmic adaptor subunit n=1 Tax=Thermithiobacillus plumbiphilus TaxID=1729899 RepID=A0ABU9D583_9PROT